MSVVTVLYQHDENRGCWTAQSIERHDAELTAQTLELLEQIVAFALRREGFVPEAVEYISNDARKERWILT